MDTKSIIQEQYAISEDAIFLQLMSQTLEMRDANTRTHTVGVIQHELRGGLHGISLAINRVFDAVAALDKEEREQQEESLFQAIQAEDQINFFALAEKGIMHPIIFINFSFHTIQNICDQLMNDLQIILESQNQVAINLDQEKVPDGTALAILTGPFQLISLQIHNHLQALLGNLSLFIDFVEKNYGQKLERELHWFSCDIRSGFQRLREVYSTPALENQYFSKDTLQKISKPYTANIPNIDIHFEPVQLPGIIKSILINFFQNALDHAFPDKPKQERKIEIIGGYDENKNYLMSFHDNGKGITQEQLPNVFIEGHSAKEGNQGVALHHLKSLLESFGGDIAITSELGKGTTFTVMISSAMVHSKKGL